ncbi:MAG TPA: sensor histidine kinase, partial [Ktedonobacterales bacterium]
EERRRLARDLHDDTAQALVALARGLDTLAGRRAGEGVLSGRDQRFVDELGVLAKRSLQSIRRACQNLRPSVLDDLGLAAALESLVTSVALSDLASGTHCVYISIGPPAPACAPEIEVTVYRIAQEAVSNALRHAHASAMEVHFGCQGDALYLCVRDDGRGFVPATAARGEMCGSEAHLGLLGMRERAALIGATLRVNSAPGAGTVVELRLPLRVDGVRVS